MSKERDSDYARGPSVTNYQIDFDQPAYLLLLLVILPLFWFWGRASMAGLGPIRWWAAWLLRTVVAVAIIAALAEIQFVHRNDRLAVIYLLDRSLSVPPDQAQAAISFINQSRSQQRDARRGDMAGIIAFGREAAVELPPLDLDVPLVDVEAKIDPQFTDLAGALRLARACFPADCAKRVVLLSDGNENLESVAEEARSLSEAGIGIDVVPLLRNQRGDVSIEKVTVPSEVRAGAPFDVRIVLNNTMPGTRDGHGAKGHLRVFRKTDERETAIADQAVEVRPGKQVFSFREEMERSDFYTYEARFIPDDPRDDALPQNNIASSFSQVRGKGRVLLIEDWTHRGEYDHLVDELRQAQLDVDLMPSNQLFANLIDLQRYDTVVLADTPRAAGDDAADVSQFSDEQVNILVQNTQQLGCGLVMLGGPNSFGAGGWTNTPIEKAMPVDFQIKGAKVVPIGALMLVIDRSGSMSGEKLEMSKAAAIAALKVLGERDQLGVVAFDTEPIWVSPMQRVGDGAAIAKRIGRLTSDGGTDMMPGMVKGYRALEKAEAGVKHMIVLTDGQTAGEGFERLSGQMRRKGITTTSVAIGSDSAQTLMQRIAQAGGGKYYRVDRPKVIPRIFMKEAMRVSRPLIYETSNPLTPRVDFPHEMLAGVSAPFPPITGYVLTTVKDNPLVEVTLSAPTPSPGQALLASWTYGLGRTAVMTTDAGQRWAKAWPEWDRYQKLYAQMIRWSMRPTSGDGKLSLFSEVRDGKLHVVVTALDRDDNFLNFLNVQGLLLDPSLQRADLLLNQTAPGRYVGEVPVDKAGNYILTILPGQGIAPLRAGINVPYSAEFQDIASNDTLLTHLAAQTPQGGEPGIVISGLDSTNKPLVANVFRHDLPQAASRQPCWHWLVFAGACLFFCDVFNRRVVVSDAIEPFALRARKWIQSRRKDHVAPALDRLQARKQQVAREIDERRAAATTYVPPPEPAASDSPEVDVVAELLQSAEKEKPASARRAEPGLTPEAADDSYTSRLLRAKRKVWDEK